MKLIQGSPNLAIKDTLISNVDPNERKQITLNMYIADSGFFFRLLVRSTVFRVFEDLKFKILEGYKQNISFPVSALLAVSV
jgi:hypothetical protein